MTWRDRYPVQVTCVRCTIVKESEELDRLLWCQDCRDLAQARAMDRGWWVGGAVAVALSVYIWIVIVPSRVMMGAWLGLILAAFYLASRLTKDVLYGLDRVRNGRAAEAVPPSIDLPPEVQDQGEDEGPPQVNLRG